MDKLKNLESTISHIGISLQSILKIMKNLRNYLKN